MRRHSDGCSGVFAYCQLLTGVVRSGKATGNGAGKAYQQRPLPGTGSVEKGIWRVLGIDDREMSWREYLFAILLLNIVGLIALFTLLMLQGSLPLNPQQLPGLSRILR